MKIVCRTTHSYEIADSQILELKQKVLEYILEEYDENFNGGIEAILDEHIKKFIEDVMVATIEGDSHHADGICYDDYFNTISFDFSNNEIVTELAHEVYYKEYKPDIITEALSNVLNDENKCTAFMARIMEEIDSDEEQYEKKSSQLIKAIFSNSAKDAIMALCGWTVNYLLQSSYLMRSTGEYKIDPADGLFCIEIGDTVHCYSCVINPVTFKAELTCAVEKDELLASDRVFVQIDGYEYPIFEENELTDTFSFWYNKESITVGE